MIPVSANVPKVRTRGVEMFKRSIWSKPARLLKRISIAGVGAIILLCMAMVTMHQVASSTLPDVLRTDYSMSPTVMFQALLAVAALGLAAIVIYGCETCWTKAARLDYQSFRRDGWTLDRTIIIVLSVLAGVASLQRFPLLDLQIAQMLTVVALAAGYALWCTTGLTLALSLIASIPPEDNGPGLFGALVPLTPIQPRLQTRAGELLPC